MIVSKMLHVSRKDILADYFILGLSNMQGMISQTEVELSVISKNFFFTFFNLFILFTVLGSVANISPLLKESLHDIGYIAHLLATKLEKYGQFYTNLILLQGVGLFPFKLLEFGSISLYPISLMGAKTPRGNSVLITNPLISEDFFVVADGDARRLCRASPTTDFQIRLLPPANAAHIYRLHRLQRSTSGRLHPLLRPPLLHHRLLHLQIPTSVRHGPQPTLDGAGLAHYLLPQHPRGGRLPSGHVRLARLQRRLHPLSRRGAAHLLHDLVQLFLRAHVRAADEIHRSEQYSSEKLG